MSCFVGPCSSVGKESPLRLVALLSVGISLALWVAAAAQAELAIGTGLPEFSLKTPDENVSTLRYQDKRLVVLLGSRAVQPEVLALHFFQPDCLPCQAQLKALDALQKEFERNGLLVLAVAHRGSTHAVQDVSNRLHLALELLMGEGSELAKAFGAGDAMALVDRNGVVRFAQVGYSPGDERIWRKNIRRLLAGQAVDMTTIERERLKVGDSLPAIRLDSLMDGSPLALVSQEDHLVFLRGTNRVTAPKATVAFLGRFCAFSREEMAALQRLHERYATQGLLVTVVGLYPDAQQAREITRQLGVTYSVFNGHGSYLEEHYAYGCPAYIADSRGMVRYTQVGFSPGDEIRYEQVIQALLKEDRASGP